jgi:signal transduction histidine kinase
MWLVPWATLACSLFATLLLCWLGALVLLSSRSRESRLAAVGLFGVGAACGAHTAMLDYPVDALLMNIGAWWRPAWIAMIAVPGTWCVLALWYAGYGQKASHLRTRLRGGVTLCVLSGIGATAASFGVDAENFVSGFAALNSESLRGVLLALPTSYALYLVFCVALALEALSRPEQSGLILRDLARRRARPYLLAATGALGLGALGGLLAFGWAVVMAMRNPDLGTFNQIFYFFDSLEFGITFLVGAAVACVGKAVVSYEVFSSRMLPRAALAGSWSIIAPAFAIWSGVVAALLGTEVPKVYALLAAALALALVSAFIAARLDRARQMLAASWSELLGGQSSLDATDDSRALEALSAMLDARLELHARGATATLLGETAHEEAEQTNQPCVVPQQAGEAWRVLLWGASREPMGVLLLWPRRPHALFTEDAIELARAAGERLIQARATAALSRQLIEVQKRAARSSAALDDTVALGGRTRRLLHDEVLPRLHAALLAPDATETRATLAEAHKMVSDILRDAPPDSSEERARFGLWTALERAANTEFDRTSARVLWHIDDAVRAMKLSSEREEALFHAAREILRNAHRYAGENIAVRISAHMVEENLVLTIEDNGTGLKAKVPSQGSGQGLVLHAALLAVAGGSLRATDAENGGTRVALSVPYD